MMRRTHINPAEDPIDSEEECLPVEDDPLEEAWPTGAVAKLVNNKVPEVDPALRV
jgi:hypothetical protein